MINVAVIETLAIAMAINLTPTVVVEPTTEYIPIVVEDSTPISLEEDEVVVVEENENYIDNDYEVMVECNYGTSGYIEAPLTPSPTPTSPNLENRNFVPNELVAVIYDNEELVNWIADEYNFVVKSWEYGVVVYDTNGQNPLYYANYNVPNTDVVLSLNYYYTYNPPKKRFPKIPNPVWGD